MAELIAICGKLCSGKSWYARSLVQTQGGVILSCDELTAALFDNDLGERHDEMAARIQRYLLTKAMELVRAGCPVVLDWGFWARADRAALRDRCRAEGVVCRWHYVGVDDATWAAQIARRNQRVAAGQGGSDYYLDEGLLAKLQQRWEPPTPAEIDVWYRRS